MITFLSHYMFLYTLLFICISFPLSSSLHDYISLLLSISLSLSAPCPEETALTGKRSMRQMQCQQDFNWKGTHRRMETIPTRWGSLSPRLSLSLAVFSLIFLRVLVFIHGFHQSTATQYETMKCNEMDGRGAVGSKPTA